MVAENVRRNPAYGKPRSHTTCDRLWTTHRRSRSRHRNAATVIRELDFINRPSRINLNVKGQAGNVEEVKVGGSAVLVARGEVIV